MPICLIGLAVIVVTQWCHWKLCDDKLRGRVCEFRVNVLHKTPRKCFSDTGRTRENVIKIVLIFICHWAKFSPTFCVSFPPSPCSNLIHFSASCAQRWSGKFRPPRVLTLPKMLFRLTLRNDHLNAGGNRALFRKSFEWMVGLCNFVSCLIDDEMGFWQVCLDPREVSSASSFCEIY